MKHTAKRITALVLVLLMTASLLASCSKGAGEPENAVTEVDGIPVYDKYSSREINLDLAENETILAVKEEDGLIRATIGVTEADYSWGVGIPYVTEHRYYNLDYVENVSKRKKTNSYHEVALDSNPNVEFVLGGEPYEDAVRYFFFKDGKSLEKVIYPSWNVDDPNEWATFYNARANIMLRDDVVYAAIDYLFYTDGIPVSGGWELFINDRFLDTKIWRPGYPIYTYCGLMEVNGAPYALLEIEEKGRLVPLAADTTELPYEGIDIEGNPTGGVFSDGRFGYFMSNTELWRTDGKDSQCIVDLVPYGVNLSSVIRTVYSLSDGRLLVIADGKLIELFEAKKDNQMGVNIYDIGILDYYGEKGELNLIISKYNNQAEHVFFRVKEYTDKTSLNLALLSGEIAMVITPNRFVLNNYVKQGFLASLEKLVPDLFEENVLIENVVDAARVEGTSYYLPLNFELRVEAIADPGLLKNGKLFETRQEYYDFITENDPEYFQKQTSGEILTSFTQNLDEWIDWKSNTAHFDDGTFEALLEFCSQGSTTEEVTEYMLQLFATVSQWGRTWKVNSFTLTDAVESYRFTDVEKALSYQKGITNTDGPEGGPTSWVQVDFPMPSSVYDGYEIFAHNLYAVVDNEESKEAAGDLLKWLILENVEEDFPEKETVPFLSMGWSGFSINRDETDRYLRRLMNGYVDPEEEVAALSEESASIASVVIAIRNDAIVHNMKCGQEQYEITWEYIHKADHLQYYQNELFDVIHEEAGRYFGGMITAKQAAEYVQNRISIYLAEQG